MDHVVYVDAKSKELEKLMLINLVEKNQDKLQITDKQFKRWAGKRYIVLIEIENFKMVEPFEIDRS